MKPFEVVGLPPDELNTFLSGTHSDPFRILGPHRSGDDLVIRVFRPDAQKVDILPDKQGDPIVAEKIHRDGFFCATAPGATFSTAFMPTRKRALGKLLCCKTRCRPTPHILTPLLFLSRRRTPRKSIASVCEKSPATKPPWERLRPPNRYV